MRRQAKRRPRKGRKRPRNKSRPSKPQSIQRPIRQPMPAAAAMADPGAVADDGSVVPAEGAVAGPTGPGWIIQLKGYHFHNTYPGKPDLVSSNDEGKEFIENTFIKALEEGTVELPDGPNGELVDVPIAKLGIEYPVVTTENPIISVTYFPEATDGDTSGRMMRSQMSEGREGVSRLGVAGDGGITQPKIWKLRRYDFTIQFFWKQTPRSARQEKPAW